MTQKREERVKRKRREKRENIEITIVHEVIFFF
jgi:hypothetical protein